MSCTRPAFFTLLALTAACAATTPATRELKISIDLRQQLEKEAGAIASLIETEWVREFTRGYDALPAIEPRVLFRSPDRQRVLLEEEFSHLPQAERSDWKRLEFSEEAAYVGNFGTPLAYARALDLAARAGLEHLRGRKVLDFGFGAPGQLVLMAALGAHVVGVDPAPLLKALYREMNGLEAHGAETDGRIELCFGRFPAEEEISRSVGKGYHLFIAKNVLKRGYIHPARPAPSWQLIDLGVDDTSFTRAVADLLEPGGVAIIYNFYPAQNPPDKEYIPWADGQTAFEERLWREAGFEVLAFDKDDTEFARRLGRALGWDQGEEAMDLDRDLFAVYTLLRKPGNP